MIDTHAHIDTEAFDEDRNEVIDRAFNDGVEKMILPAIEPAGFDKLLEITENDDRLFCGIGIHPHHSNEIDDDDITRVEKESSRDCVVSIGEIGLDYYYDFSPPERQKEVFRRQLNIARETGLPVIIHNREADDDILDILGESQDGSLSGVLHCFSSPVDVMKKVVDLGFHVSFTGNITFKNSKLGEVVKEAPMDRVMIETDSPYMTPAPFRKIRRNEPFYVKYIAEKIAEYKSLSIKEVISMTTKNAEKLFKLALFLVLFCSLTGLAYAQDDEYRNEDGDLIEIELEEKIENPYAKFIGFGPFLGFNTIVETYFIGDLEDERSQEGLIAYGGSVLYSPFEFLVLEVAYLYSKNTKIAEQLSNTINPSTYQLFDISTHWIANPHGRINIFATAGLSMIFNSLGGAEMVEGKLVKTSNESNQLGLNAGVGFYFNIPTGFGLLTPTFEWRMNFTFNRIVGSDARINPDDPSGPPIINDREISNFFSIPRFGIIWYPPL